MYHRIQQVIDTIDFDTISDGRKHLLQPLINYIQEKRKNGGAVQLNFICTHNSRRSQFSQVWAAVAAHYYTIEANIFSAGVEVTAFNPLAVQSLERFGFDIKTEYGENPHYSVDFSFEAQSIVAFSKLIENPINPAVDFAAIMTCSHADENCPFVPGADARIPVRYEDPKKYDGTPLETTLYDYRSFEIASEMFYVFSKIV